MQLSVSSLGSEYDRSEATDNLSVSPRTNVVGTRERAKQWYQQNQQNIIQTFSRAKQRAPMPQPTPLTDTRGHPQARSQPVIKSEWTRRGLKPMENLVGAPTPVTPTSTATRRQQQQPLTATPHRTLTHLVSAQPLPMNQSRSDAIILLRSLEEQLGVLLDLTDCHAKQAVRRAGVFVAAALDGQHSPPTAPGPHIAPQHTTHRPHTANEGHTVRASQPHNRPTPTTNTQPTKHPNHDELAKPSVLESLHSMLSSPGSSPSLTDHPTHSNMPDQKFSVLDNLRNASTVQSAMKAVEDMDMISSLVTSLCASLQKQKDQFSQLIGHACDRVMKQMNAQDLVIRENIDLETKTRKFVDEISDKLLTTQMEYESIENEIQLLHEEYLILKNPLMSPKAFKSQTPHISSPTTSPKAAPYGDANGGVQGSNTPTRQPRDTTPSRHPISPRSPSSANSSTSPRSPRTQNEKDNPTTLLLTAVYEEVAALKKLIQGRTTPTFSRQKDDEPASSADEIEVEMDSVSSFKEKLPPRTSRVVDPVIIHVQDTSTQRVEPTSPTPNKRSGYIKSPKKVSWVESSSPPLRIDDDLKDLMTAREVLQQQLDLIVNSPTKSARKFKV